jgi:hypothetical protein
MSDLEPYTRDEMTDDVIDWQASTDEQKLAIFDELIAVVTADAYHQRDNDLIQRLRRMRATRDGSKS